MAVRLVFMKRHLALGGKWLAGTAGITALGYLVATEAANGRHPIWPYGLFGVLLVVGLALYFMCQDTMEQESVVGNDASRHDDVPTPAADDQVWGAWNEQYYNEHDMAARPQSPPGDPFTDRWRHTADGFKASPLMNIASYTMPGYMGSRDASPFIRIGVCVACASVDPDAADSSQIREALVGFLGRDPVASLVRTTTYTDRDTTWAPQAGRGPLRIEAVLGAGEQPVASAMLHLPFQNLRQAGRADDIACLWLQIVPQEEDGAAVQPTGLASWYQRLVLALSIAGSLVDLLYSDLGLNPSDQPAARVGVMLQAKASLRELVDPGELPTLPGATPSNQFLGYAIANPAGKPNGDAARDFLRQLCDYDLQVDVTKQFLRSIGELPEPGSNVLIPWRGGTRIGTVVRTEPSEVDPRVIVDVPLEGNDMRIRQAFGADVVQLVPHPSLKP